MAEPRVPRSELPFFRTYLGRWAATRSWQKLMRKEIRSEVEMRHNPTFPHLPYVSMILSGCNAPSPRVPEAAVDDVALVLRKRTSENLSELRIKGSCLYQYSALHRKGKRFGRRSHGF